MAERQDSQSLIGGTKERCNNAKPEWESSVSPGVVVAAVLLLGR